MRHQVHGKHLGRTSAHRTALRRNLAASLFEHGTITTTRQKAKFVRPFAERLITLAKSGTLHDRRRAISLLQDRAICKVEDGEPVRQTSVVRKLFGEIGPQFALRQGGYTRIVPLPLRRIGDGGQLVILQLVSEKVTPASRKTDIQQDKTLAPDQTGGQDVPEPQPDGAARPEPDVAENSTPDAKD